MLRQSLVVYLALMAGAGGLLLAGVPVDRVLFLGLFVFMLIMHTGGHGHGHVRRGQRDHEEHDTQEAQDRGRPMALSPQEDQGAGK